MFSQNPEWVNFIDSKDIRALAEEGDYIWIGTSGGLCKFHKLTGSKVYYYETNS